MLKRLSLLIFLSLFWLNVNAAWEPIAGWLVPFADSNGDPYSGAVLKFYEAGTSTNIVLATDNTGGTTVTDVQLNANGYPEVSGNIIIPHLDQDYKIALYPTQAAADSDTGAIYTVDDINLTTAATNEWISSGLSPTRTSNTTFTVSGDQTSALHTGRRLRTTDTGGTDYCTITNSVYTTLTTVTGTCDSSGVWDSGLSVVDYGILSANNLSYPSKLSGDLDLNGYTIPESEFTTGDAKLTLKTTADSGWVMADDGTIGSAASGATTRANADTEELFELLWNNISDTYAPVSGGRGGSAQADFDADKTITLPALLGRTLLIAGAGSGLTTRALGETGGSEDAINVSHGHGNTFSVASNGAHTHNTQYHASGIGTTVGTQSGNSSTTSLSPATTSSGSHGHSLSGSVSSSGSSGTDANLGPWGALNVMIKL